MNKKLKSLISMSIAASVAAGGFTFTVNASEMERSFFDSVIRYISFDEDTSDFKGNTADAADVEIEEGKYGNAGVFNGTTSNINLGSIDVSQGKSFTVAYWIKAGENHDAIVVGNKDWETGSNAGWTTGIYNNAIKANSAYGNSGKDKEERADTSSYTLNDEWVYFTAVYDMKPKGVSKISTYINGEPYSEHIVTAGSLETGYDTIIGKDSAADVRFYAGMIDEFLMCDRVLSQDEIIYAMNICEDGGTFAEKYNSFTESSYIELTSSAGSVEMGESAVVPLSYQGESIDPADVSYSSSNEAVAEVTEDGEIIPISMGEAVIYVTYDDGDISYSGEYTVTVTGKKYIMSEREDKSSNPSSDGWEFMYAAKGTDEYIDMTSYTESGDIWRKGLTGNDQYVRLNGTGYGHHPGADDDVIIKWTAPENGYINIKGNIIATAYSETNRDGINLTVSKAGEQTSELEKINVSFDNDFQSGGKNIDLNTAVTAGEAIYFRIDNDVNNSADGFNFNPEITYIEEKTSVTLGSESGELKVGESAKVPVVTMGGADESLITYSSVNDDIASVDSDGNITANAMGTTMIKVGYDDGRFSFNEAYTISVIGDRYIMSEREDKEGNPSSDGWSFVYAPVGTNEYVNFEKHSASSDEWSTDAEGYTRINASGSNSHPGSVHDVAIVWTAQYDGFVNLGGHFENTNSSSSDGVKLTVLKEEAELMSVISNNNGGADLNKTVEVKQGEKIYFRFNCVGSNGNDHFMFDPIITYTTAGLDTQAESYLVKEGGSIEIKTDELEVQAVSANTDIADIDTAAGLVINGKSVGKTKILLEAGDKTKVVNVEVTNDIQPYAFSFGGAEQTNSGAEYRVFTHMNTGDAKTVINDISFDILFDSSVCEMINYKGESMTSANEVGAYSVSSAPSRIMSSENKYDADSTRLNTMYFRVIDQDADKMQLTLVSPVINGVAIDEELCTIENRTISINLDPDEDKNGDGLISVGDVAKASADGEDESSIKNIAQKAGFYPVKRVFVIGVDGAGNSVDPVDAWYQYSNQDGTPSGNEVKFSEIGGKPEDKRWSFFEETIMKEGAYTFDSLPCNPSMSAPNWTAILHGYNYYDAPADTATVVQRIDNDDSGSLYFPENDSKWSSFMKIAREQMPNRNLISNSNWSSIDNGIIEQSIGVWCTPYSSRYEYDGRDTEIADAIAQQIDDGITKNMSVMFVHLDELDHAGHDAGKGFYSDAYYNEVQNKDDQLETIYNAIFTNEDIKDDTVLIITTDHGGQSHYHGGKNPSELYSFISLNGAVINTGYSWSGDIDDEEAKKEDATRSQTRDIPALVAKSLGLDADPDWKGSLNRASGAFLTQKEMINKGRDIETVEYGDGKISITNLSNKITAMDVTFTYSGDIPTVSVSDGSKVYLSENENGSMHMIIYNADGLNSNCIVSDSEIDVQNVMLSTDDGKEIYPDIKIAESNLIERVTAADGSAFTADDINTEKSINITAMYYGGRSTMMAAAAYDENGVLLGIKTAEVTANNNTIETAIDNPAFGNENAVALKLFWLEDMENMVPVADCFSVK